MYVYALYDYQGNWQVQWPTYVDFYEACRACRRFIRRYPDKGINVRRLREFSDDSLCCNG